MKEWSVFMSSNRLRKDALAVPLKYSFLEFMILPAEGRKELGNRERLSLPKHYGRRAGEMVRQARDDRKASWAAPGLGAGAPATTQRGPGTASPFSTRKTRASGGFITYQQSCLHSAGIRGFRCGP